MFTFIRAGLLAATLTTAVALTAAAPAAAETAASGGHCWQHYCITSG
ncbi:hypothetical protein CLV63_11932 [Murinocardiopsis flavida]|uniref:Uncharacterized protein n=1 Tax=Murinocardiopsis flavida TaxID=645275 RepID=A0A2P8D3F7_9ACTN|nr:hypothetical protein [Murinocardiopsis flavida]PSK91751.1 hypothetical protein CLV63_11932 [Murinocardiopsis flavida]